MNSFDWDRFEWIGFDMDHTMVNYTLDGLYPLIYEALIDYLVEIHGYPKSVFCDHEEYKYDFATKGAILDVANGNFVDLNKDGHVCCAKHGLNKVLSEEEIDAIYGKERVFKYFDKIQRFEKELDKYLLFYSPFGLPAAQVLGILIDYIDAQNGEKDYSKLSSQIFDGFNYFYDPSALEKRIGLFFPKILENPSRYIVKCDPQVLEFLKLAKQRGKKVFLMTNSRLDFTNVVMGASFGENWVDLFDLVITHAMKPQFFSNPENKFLNCETGKEYTPVDGKNPILSGGHWKSLQENCGIGKTENSVLYFGDDLNGDIAALCKTENTWKGVAIVEELDTENVHANEEHVFHCPKASKNNFETEWYAAIERNAVLCCPSVKSFSKAANKTSDGKIHDCKKTDDEKMTMWYPILPRELLKTKL